MQFPVELKLGDAVIPLHLVFETLAYFVGYRYYSYLRKHQHDDISDNNRLYIFIGAALGAFLGSHLVGIFEYPENLHQLNALYFMKNKTIVGGMLGGLIGVELVKKRIGVNVSSGDLMVYPLIIAMIIGRTGCFLSGLQDGTYGTASNLPWAINFGDGITRHPTNSYEIVFWAILYLAISFVERERTLANGARFKIFLASYLVFRFLIEFIKPAYFFGIGLSTIQLVCFAGILYYYKVFIKPYTLFQLKPHA